MVLGCPPNIQLRDQGTAARYSNGDVNVRRSAGVGHWLYGAKTVLPVGSRLETTLALEIGIPFPETGSARRDKMVELGHVALRVRELERAIDFYERAVGLEIVGRIAPSAPVP